MKSEAYLHNERQLKEINDTLISDGEKKSGKIGIFLPSKNGDIITAMSVLKYKDLLWKGKEIIWFCNLPSADAFKFSTISEVRPYPWEGIDVDLFTQLKTKDNRIDQIRKHEFEITADLDEGYFPAPWMLTLEERHGMDYTNISKKIFGVDQNLEWHPCLWFSDEERNRVKDVVSKLPSGRKTIMLETACESGQSGWNDTLTKRTIEICREQLGACNFIFASYGDHSRFIDDEGMISCNNFTVRQTALFNNYSDLFIGISSGISVATSCWGNAPTPKLQFCNSQICSTVALAVGEIQLVAPNDNQNNMSAGQKSDTLQRMFESRLIQMLKQL